MFSLSIEIEKKGGRRKVAVRPYFFISCFTNPPTAIFRKLEKKSKIISIYYSPTLNISCFAEKIIYF